VHDDIRRGSLDGLDERVGIVDIDNRRVCTLGAHLGRRFGPSRRPGDPVTLIDQQRCYPSTQNPGGSGQEDAHGKIPSRQVDRAAGDDSEKKNFKVRQPRRENLVWIPQSSVADVAGSSARP
jgi:hypothetical protein